MFRASSAHCFGKRCTQVRWRTIGADGDRGASRHHHNAFEIVLQARQIRREGLQGLLATRPNRHAVGSLKTAHVRELRQGARLDQGDLSARHSRNSYRGHAADGPRPHHHDSQRHIRDLDAQPTTLTVLDQGAGARQAVRDVHGVSRNGSLPRFAWLSDALARRSALRTSCLCLVFVAQIRVHAPGRCGLCPRHNFTEIPAAASHCPRSTQHAPLPELVAPTQSTACQPEPKRPPVYRVFRVHDWSRALFVLPLNLLLPCV